VEVEITRLKVAGFLCEECEALWFRSDEISPTNFLDFGKFMESRGLKGVWSEVTRKE
jgi:hypothetical protein